MQSLMSGALSADRPALVLVHGFALDARVWRPQIRGEGALAADHRVLTLDLPGFGPQARELGQVEPATEMGRAIDATRLERVHLVASEFGAAVAVDYALKHPERVASLVLVGPLMLGRRTGIDAWQRCVALASEGDKTTAAEVWLDDPLFESLRGHDALFEEVRQIVLDYGGGHWTGKISSAWNEPEPTTRLPELAVPTLIVSGEADLASFMVMAEAYAKAIPDARREIIRGVGHHVTLEAAAEFNALLRVWVAGVGSAAGEA